MRLAGLKLHVELDDLSFAAHFLAGEGAGAHGGDDRLAHSFLLGDDAAAEAGMGGGELAVFDFQAGDVHQHAHAQAGGAGGGQVAAVGGAGEQDHGRIGRLDGGHGGVGVGAGAERREVRAFSGEDLLGAVAAGLRGQGRGVGAHDGRAYVAADVAGEGAAPW